MRFLLSAVIAALCVVMASTDQTTSSSSVEMDAKKQAGLELLMRLFKKFSIRFFDIVFKDIADTQSYSALINFFTLWIYAYLTNGRATTALTKGLGFRGDDRETLEVGFRTFFEFIDDYSPDELSVRSEVYHSSCDSTTREFSELTNQVFNLSLVYDGSLAQLTQLPCTSSCFKILLWKMRQLVAVEPQSVLTNSVKFNGQWKTKFNSSLSKYSMFWINNWNPFPTKTMYVEGLFRYGKVPEIGSPFVELPMSDRVSMFLLCSQNAREYYELAQQMGQIDFEQLIRDNSMKYVKLTVPEFKIETSLLGNSWIPRFFRANRTNNVSKFLPQNLISSAMMDVNEGGTTFSAIPVINHIARKARSAENHEEIVLNVDRPFIASVVTTGEIKIELGTTIVTGSTFEFTIDDNDDDSD